MRRFVVASILLSAPLEAQDKQLTVERIFASREFRSATMPSVHWLRDGQSYVDVRSASSGEGSDIVRVDLTTGTVTTLAAASDIVDPVTKERIEVEDLQLSADESKALLFHSSVRVWRTNSRGMYHVIDFATKKLTPIARITTPGTPAINAHSDTGTAKSLGSREDVPSFMAPPLKSNLQMFAKFSPDGRKVAFVRDNDLFVTTLATGATTRLTTDGSENIINGTTDWVYEEELGLKDAFRWSPDSRRLAYWRFDQSHVAAYPMVNETEVYAKVSVLRYPQAGQPNAKVKIAVVDLNTRKRAWMDVGGDTGIYLARMEWLGADSVIIQRMPRRQNQVDVLVRSALTGKGRTMFSDRDSAYVDIEDQPVWTNGSNREFVWLSDRSGWRQAFLVDRSGKVIRQITTDGVDVISIAGIDSARRHLYVVAAAPMPTQRQVFRFSLDGGAGERVTQAPGTHAITIGPGGRYLVDRHSALTSPTTATLYSLPEMRVVRVLQDNATLKRNLAALPLRAPEFFKLPMPDGTQLDAMRFVPANFDSTRKHPVLVYVYGGPASPTVNDAWGSTRYLWHQMLSQKGYVVIYVDNRGSAWRGVPFRKITQLDLGENEARDQIDAAKWLGQRSWVDASRIGMWGWSYGGYLTALATAKGGSLFKAAIVGAPVTDWRLYDTIYTERFMWTPQDNAEGYRRSAPQNHVESLTARWLIIHGLGDDNVHPQNTIQLVDKLNKANKNYYVLLYPNQTHGVSGQAQIHQYNSMLRFILENL